MKGMTADPQVVTYTDRWRTDRYRVELSVNTPYGVDDIDAALLQLGYDMVDADQSGLSYSKRQDRDCCADLDELDDDLSPARLILAVGNLEESQIDPAQEQLYSIYGRIRQICRKDLYLYDYGPWKGSMGTGNQLDWPPYLQLQE